MRPLMLAVMQAHQEAARRNDNASSQLIRALAGLGVPFSQAVVGAMQSLGELHGPVTQARRLLYHTPEPELLRILDSGKRVPGWGNSFFKEEIDPAWKPVVDVMQSEHPEDWKRISDVTRVLHRRGYKLYPNAAAFTAVAAERMGVPEGTELSLFVQARIHAWAVLWAESRCPAEVAECL